MSLTHILFTIFKDQAGNFSILLCNLCAVLYFIKVSLCCWQDYWIILLSSLQYSCNKIVTAVFSMCFEVVPPQIEFQNILFQFLFTFFQSQIFSHLVLLPIAISGFHRTTELISLQGTTVSHLVQLPCSRRIKPKVFLCFILVSSFYQCHLSVILRSLVLFFCLVICMFLGSSAYALNEP